MRRLLVVVGVVLILFAAATAGVWWYLFGPASVDPAKLLPENTVAVATIPNGTAILAGYEASRIKTVIDSPILKSLLGAGVSLVGNKNLELIQSFAPNLSGQSFIAVTHYDYNHPDQIGFVAAFKPKPGFDHFDAFLAELKSNWPDLVQQGTPGKGNVDGVDYESIQGPGASDKICVARIGGWVVTTWGEAPLRDWIERYQGKSSSPSLADNPDYQKSIARVGADPMTLIYINGPQAIASLPPGYVNALPVGGIATAARFENGEIADRFSVLLPRAAQLSLGLSPDPCAFDTMKFTSPGTRLYWAASLNWKQLYQALQSSSGPSSAAVMFNPEATYAVNMLRSYAQDAGLDVQHNIIDALGPEMSVQAEWNSDNMYPEVGAFIQIAKPDDFKPAVNAVINSARKNYAQVATVNETQANGQKLATVRFTQASPYSPTVTENGPYFGAFSSENLADESFQRDPSATLLNNADLKRQLGDRLPGASQLVFLDTPHTLDRGYEIAVPYLTIAGMFNHDVAEFLKGRQLPQDMAWLGPVGTWTCVTRTDDDGLESYSVSGIGNQGLIYAAALSSGINLLQSAGLLPKTLLPAVPNSEPAAPVVTATPPIVTVPTAANNSAAITNATDPIAPSVTPAPTNSAPDTVTPPDATTPASPLPAH